MASGTRITMKPSSVMASGQRVSPAPRRAPIRTIMIASGSMMKAMMWSKSTQSGRTFDL